MVRDAGHEIGLHGYSHENPSDMVRLDDSLAVETRSYPVVLNM